VLSRANHPALRAMIPLGAGGAVGSAAGRYSYFGLFEGGVFELASGFGWFVEHGASDPRTPLARPFDIATALRDLPVADLVRRHRPGPNGYDDFLSMPLTDPKWHDLGYLDDSDAPTVPTLEVSTWGDQTVGDTLALDESLRRKASGAAPASAPERHLIVAPGTHCHSQETGESERFGELSVKNAAQPYFEMYERWFDFWVRDRGDGLAKMPAIRYYLIGEARWLDASRWPPAETSLRRWYLDGAGHANSAGGDGALLRSPPTRLASDGYVDDPANPVPSRGGPACCTGQPEERPGPANQKDVESRADVLVYTSPVLDAPQRIAGPLHAVLTVSSSALDTDFVARLVDVFPDGRAISVQEGALRARYRDRAAKPSLLVPGEHVTLTVDMRSIAYSVAAGHRLRLDVASSSFPRLERNLHTGGDNAHDTHGVSAHNRVFHGPDAPSYVELPLLPAATATP
jgi:putative CocE/NonD family hydrolase